MKVIKTDEHRLIVVPEGAVVDAVENKKGGYKTRRIDIVLLMGKEKYTLISLVKDNIIDKMINNIFSFLTLPHVDKLDIVNLWRKTKESLDA